MGGQLADNRKISNKRKGRLSEKAIFFCYLGVNIMKYDKKKAIEIIIHAAKNYKDYLQDKVFLIIYTEHSVTKMVQVEFRSSHFLHLTGVNTKLSAKRFYEKCINQKLSIDDFELEKGGKTQQKLMVLPFLHEILYNNCMIGNFINSGIYIRADYFVGNTRTILSVGFRYGKKFDFPVTLYREDVRKLTHPTNKVLAIFAKKCKEEKYSECSYLSKRQKIEKLINTDKIDLEKIGNIK